MQDYSTSPTSEPRNIPTHQGWGWAEIVQGGFSTSPSTMTDSLTKTFSTDQRGRGGWAEIVGEMAAELNSNE